MDKIKKIQVLSDIAKHEKNTGLKFRTAHKWIKKERFFSHIVTLSDLGK